jgi:hypothetical protein
MQKIFVSLSRVHKGITLHDPKKGSQKKGGFKMKLKKNQEEFDLVLYTKEQFFKTFTRK